MGGDSVVAMLTRGIDDDATALAAGTVMLLPSARKPNLGEARRYCLVPGSLILGRPRALGRLPLRPLQPQADSCLPLRPQGKLSQTTALGARGGPGPARGTPPGFQKLPTYYLPYLLIYLILA